MLGLRTPVYAPSSYVAATPQPIAVPRPAPIHIPTAAELLPDVIRLDVALRLTVPLMDDVSGNTPASPGAILLASWMSTHGYWDALLAMPDSKRAEIMKDSEAMRGRRICVSGTVVEIARDKTAPFQLYIGGMSQGMANFVRFLAVGSAEGVLENQWARFCGITPGTQNYPNVSGGETHAVQIVGSFDLKARPPEDDY